MRSVVASIVKNASVQRQEEKAWFLIKGKKGNVSIIEEPNGIDIRIFKNGEEVGRKKLGAVAAATKEVVKQNIEDAINEIGENPAKHIREKDKLISKIKEAGKRNANNLQAKAWYIKAEDEEVKEENISNEDAGDENKANEEPVNEEGVKIENENIEPLGTDKGLALTPEESEEKKQSKNEKAIDTQPDISGEEEVSPDDMEETSVDSDLLQELVADIEDIKYEIEGLKEIIYAQSDEDTDDFINERLETIKSTAILLSRAYKEGDSVKVKLDNGGEVEGTVESIDQNTGEVKVKINDSETLSVKTDNTITEQ